MKKFLMLLLLAAPAIAYAQADASKKDLQRLQGTWELNGLEVNGQQVAVDRLQGTVLTIKDNRYEVNLKEKRISKVDIKLDPAKDPAEMDMTFLEGTNKDQVHKAIYKIEGDTFKMARGLNPDQARPREFATWPGTNYFVVTWKKKTP